MSPENDLIPKEPPPRRRREGSPPAGPIIYARLLQIRASPRVWFRIFVWKNKSKATDWLKNGRLNHPAELEGYQIASRSCKGDTPSGYSELYAQWLGQKIEEEK